MACTCITAEQIGPNAPTGAYAAWLAADFNRDCPEHGVKLPEPFYDEDGITIYHGDCLDVLPALGQVDHVITDPPYAADVYVRLAMPNTKKGSETPDRLIGDAFALNNGGRLGQLAAGAIGNIDAMLDEVAAWIGSATKRWGIVFSDVETCHRWRQQLEAAGLRYVRTGAWVKPDAMPQMTGDRPSVGFEPCTIAHAQGPMRWNGGGLPALWTHNTVKGADRPDHPCPKPLPLMRQLIELFTDPGDLIVDPFGGSMTTAVAAKQTGRRCISIEIDEEWCRAGALRVKDAHFQPSLIGVRKRAPRVKTEALL